MNEIEIIKFMTELEQWMETSKKLRFKYNFDPMLFAIWRLGNKNTNTNANTK